MRFSKERQILARFGLFPLSLAATDGIDVSFFSSRYLDVSVPWVRFHTPMNSAQDDLDYSRTRFRIQKSPDRRLFASFPELIAGYHVFRRLSMPRHPPYTLSSLTTFIDHCLRNFSARTIYTGGPIKTALTPLSPGRACPKTEQTTDKDQIRQKGARRLLPETGQHAPISRRKNQNQWAEVAEV